MIFRTAINLLLIFTLLSCVGAGRVLAIDINPENQVGPTVERWGWDIKGSQNQTSTTAKAELLYDEVPANMIRIPIFVEAHSSDGSVNASIYSNEITSIQNARAQNPDLQVFASVKLLGGNTFIGPASDPAWVTQGTAQWPVEQGSIFGNTVDKPNPEFYSQLVADFFDYMGNQGIQIDHIGINNETDRALDVPRYIDSVDRLKTELTSRGYDTNSLNFIAPDAFNISETEDILNDLISAGRGDTFDTVGSHQYPQFANHTSDHWQTFSNITGGKDLWHTELHMNASNANNGGTANDNILRMRDGMGIMFSANLNGADSFVWWGGATNTEAIGATLKREIIKSTIHGHAVESPVFDEHDPDPDAPIYQAYRKGDLVTLWVAHPESADASSFPVDLLEGTIATEGGLTVVGEYWQGGAVAGTFGNDINAQSHGNLSINLNGDNRGFVVDTVNENSISKISIVMTGRLVWNQGSGNFDEGFARSNGYGDVGATAVDPYGYNGTEALYVANGGFVTLDNSTNSSSGTAVESMLVGTNQASGVIDNRNGFAIVTANDSVSLTIGDGQTQVGEVGNLTVGDGGQQGLFTWNSTGTLNVEGKLRIGQNGGLGQFTQNNGTVIAGATAGSNKFVAIGNGTASDGTYNLNNGTLVLGGGLTGGQLRELRVGSATTGQFNLGDSIGTAESAVIETRRNITIGHNGGIGTLTVNSDGQIVQVTNGAPFSVGEGGGDGTVTQTGGSVNTEHHVSIGTGSGSLGLYTINGGSLNVGSDGSGELRIGGNGGNGSLLVEGDATVHAGAELIIANTDSAGSTGLLQIFGSEVDLSVGKLDNALGTDETISWEADALGISPLVVRGDVGSSLFVELQHPSEIAFSIDGVGDGIALELDLSELTVTNTVLTLIDNQSEEAIQGMFENPMITNDLYEEGEFITGTGFDGLVSISYVGGTGNDVVLNLSGSENADFDGDLDIDGADFLIWQRGFGSPGGLSQGDANNNGSVDQADLDIWYSQFNPGTIAGATITVPEPAGYLLILGFCAIACGRTRNIR